MVDKKYIVLVATLMVGLGPWALAQNETGKAGYLTPVAPAHNDKLDKKELKSLIATAKTPEEHLRLAAHYRAEANDYLARQKQHEADEKEYNSNPRKYSTKYPTPAQHCRDWAYNDGQSAKKALALAEMHEAMARDAAR